MPFENSLILKKFSLIICVGNCIGVLCHSIPCSHPNAVNAVADRATARAHRQMRVKEGGLPEFGHSANQL
jgi:hypothetical protein